MARLKLKTLIGICVLGVGLVGGCKKAEPVADNVAPPPPPPPAPAAMATASLTAEPSSIERGQSATLKWSSTNAVSAELNQGIGAVQVTGSREVFPTRSTEYVITVKNKDGKTSSARANITVRQPAPPPPEPKKEDPYNTISAFLERDARDALFDYDKYDIRPDAESALRNNANVLKDAFAKFKTGNVLVEGHCDERGTSEYNLALGDRRAGAARDFLVQLGIPSSRLRTVSYGEERSDQGCDSEGCWQKNRRAHLSETR